MSMALTDNGKLFTWGSNVKGILGQGNMTEVRQSNTPKEVDIIKNTSLANQKKFYHIQAKRDELK